MNKRQLGFFLMALSALGLASSNIIVKLIHLNAELPAGHIGIWRFTIAAPLMWISLMIKKPSDGWMPKSTWRFLGLGIVFAIASFSSIFALERLAPSLYVIIIYIYPSLVVLYSLISGKRVPRLYWFGLPLTIVGLILTTYDFGQSIVVDTLGVLITLLNAWGMASYVILSEHVFASGTSRHLGTTWMATSTMLVGWLASLFLGISLPRTLNGWLLMLAFGIFGTMLPLLAMNTGLQLIGAARGALINMLQPVLAVLFSVIFLGDRLSLQQWIGGALVILAVILLQRSPDQKKDSDNLEMDELLG